MGGHRPTSYAQAEDYARAGAVTRSRIHSEVADAEHDARDEQRYQDQQMRAAKSQALNDEMQRWEFERKRALDENAAALKIEMDRGVVAANQALREIDTSAPDARVKLAQWRAAHYRVLADPRISAQEKINQEFIDSRQKFADEAAQAKAAYELRKADEAAAGPKVTMTVTEERDADFPNEPPITTKKTTVTGTPAQVNLPARPDLRNIQTKLKEFGFFNGTVDGEDGDETTAALRRYQTRNGLEVTGTLDEKTSRALGGSAPSTRGKDFLKSLGITPKPPKLKVIPGTGGAIEG